MDAYSYIDLPHLDHVIANVVREFADARSFESFLWHQDSSLWMVEQKIQDSPLMRRIVEVAGFFGQKGNYLYFMPQLSRWEGKENGGSSIAKPYGYGETAIKYPVNHLYPISGNQQETEEKLRVLLRYAWLMVELFEESDLKVPSRE